MSALLRVRMPFWKRSPAQLQILMPVLVLGNCGRLLQSAVSACFGCGRRGVPSWSPYDTACKSDLLKIVMKDRMVVRNSPLRGLFLPPFRSFLLCFLPSRETEGNTFFSSCSYSQKNVYSVKRKKYVLDFSWQAWPLKRMIPGTANLARCPQDRENR